MPQIDAYLKKLDEVGGSDLHLSSGVTPKVRQMMHRPCKVMPRSR